jgi:hypothetical protein
MTRRNIVKAVSRSRTRLVPPRGAESASVVQFQQQRRFVRPFQAPRKNSVGSSRPRSPASRDWKWRTADWHPSTRHRSGLKIPPRPLSAAGMPSAKWCAILTKERGGRTGNASSPLSFPPFGNPPFLIPPPKLESTKGGKTAGGTGTAAYMARLKKPRGPSLPAEPRAAALRVPGPLRRLSPLLLGPRGAGRSVGPPCGSRAHHHSGPPRCSQAHP